MNPLRRIVTAFALMGAFVAFAALGADHRETRTVTGFTGLALAAPIHVELVQGDTEGLVLDGEEAALAELETTVEQGVLKIRTRSRVEPRGMARVRARLSAKLEVAYSARRKHRVDAGSFVDTGCCVSVPGS